MYVHSCVRKQISEESPKCSRIWGDFYNFLRLPFCIVLIFIINKLFYNYINILRLNTSFLYLTKETWLRLLDLSFSKSALLLFRRKECRRFTDKKPSSKVHESLYIVVSETSHFQHSLCLPVCVSEFWQWLGWAVLV